MQSTKGSPEEPPLVEIDYKGQSFETYVVITDAVAEAAYLIKEVLIDDCYLKHGLQIKPGATVVDIGANIGLFGVRAISAVPGGDVTYIGVEPVPANFTALQYNLLGSTCSTTSTGTTGSAAAGAGSAGGTAAAAAAAAQSFFHFNAAFADAVAAPAAGRISKPYPGNIRLISKAVSDAPGSLPITFYPRMPGNSTLRPTEKAALQQHLMPSYFSAAQQFEVPVITSQQLLREALPDGSSIDLLKVDVEGEELAVLQGLDEEGWQRVQQVVAEVHDCLPGEFGEPRAGGAAAAAAAQASAEEHEPHAAPEPQHSSSTTVAEPPSSATSTAAATATGSLPVTAAGSALPAAQLAADIDGYWIHFVPGGELPSSHSDDADAASGHGATQAQQAAGPPRHHGRVIAVARLLKALGFRVVVECCMLPAVGGSAGNYNVYARRAELCR